MINLTSSTLIYRPVRQVFDFISTPENDFQWQYGTLETAKISEGATKVGTSFRTIGHLLGQRILSTFEVTEYDANRKYGFRSLTGPLQSHTSYTFRLERGCTEIEVSTQANPVNSLLHNEKILEKRMKKQLKENLELLKDILEKKTPGEAHPRNNNE
jgi:hypothetical protein